MRHESKSKTSACGVATDDDIRRLLIEIHSEVTEGFDNLCELVWVMGLECHAIRG